MFYFFKSKASFEAETSRKAMEACEHVVSEMGAELHDDLIQKLSVFRLYLDRLDRATTDQGEIELLVLSMNAEFVEVVQAVRRISRRLLPVRMEDDSFQTTISILCQNLERPGGSTIHFESHGINRKMDSLAEVYLYRITQELIHNALKHSSAWHVWVKLVWHPNHFFLEVEDDGTGFSKIPEFILSLQKKYNSLRMRATVIGAKIEYLAGKKGLLARVEYSDH